MSYEIIIDGGGPLRTHDARADGVGNQKFCGACDGFRSQQAEPGLWVVCWDCHGSGFEGVLGDETPGDVIRNARLDERETLGERATRRKREEKAKTNGQAA